MNFWLCSVTDTASGRPLQIVPQVKWWDDLFLNGPRASEDFIVPREQQVSSA
jgi:antitoxin VapB